VNDRVSLPLTTKSGPLGAALNDRLFLASSWLPMKELNSSSAKELLAKLSFNLSYAALICIFMTHSKNTRGKSSENPK
jgi:hypothetical protein